jgi:hypothetical protein
MVLRGLDWFDLVDGLKALDSQGIQTMHWKTLNDPTCAQEVAEVLRRHYQLLLKDKTETVDLGRAASSKTGADNIAP